MRCAEVDIAEYRFMITPHRRDAIRNDLLGRWETELRRARLAPLDLLAPRLAEMVVGRGTGVTSTCSDCGCTFDGSSIASLCICSLQILIKWRIWHPDDESLSPPFAVKMRPGLDLEGASIEPEERDMHGQHVIMKLKQRVLVGRIVMKLSSTIHDQGCATCMNNPNETNWFSYFALNENRSIPCVVASGRAIHFRQTLLVRDWACRLLSPKRCMCIVLDVDLANAVVLSTPQGCQPAVFPTEHISDLSKWLRGGIVREEAEKRVSFNGKLLALSPIFKNPQGSQGKRGPDYFFMAHIGIEHDRNSSALDLGAFIIFPHSTFFAWYPLLQVGETYTFRKIAFTHIFKGDPLRRARVLRTCRSSSIDSRIICRLSPSSVIDAKSLPSRVFVGECVSCAGAVSKLVFANILLLDQKVYVVLDPFNPSLLETFGVALRVGVVMRIFNSHVLRASNTEVWLGLCSYSSINIEKFSQYDTRSMVVASNIAGLTRKMSRCQVCEVIASSVSVKERFESQVHSLDSIAFFASYSSNTCADGRSAREFIMHGQCSSSCTPTIVKNSLRLVSVSRLLSLPQVRRALRKARKSGHSILHSHELSCPTLVGILSPAAYGAIQLKDSISASVLLDCDLPALSLECLGNCIAIRDFNLIVEPAISAESRCKSLPPEFDDYWEVPKVTLRFDCSADMIISRQKSLKKRLRDPENSRSSFEGGLIHICRSGQCADELEVHAMVEDRLRTVHFVGIAACIHSALRVGRWYRFEGVEECSQIEPDRFGTSKCFIVDKYSAVFSVDRSSCVSFRDVTFLLCVDSSNANCIVSFRGVLVSKTLCVNNMRHDRESYLHYSLRIRDENKCHFVTMYAPVTRSMLALCLIPGCILTIHRAMRRLSERNTIYICSNVDTSICVEALPFTTNQELNHSIWETLQVGRISQLQNTLGCAINQTTHRLNAIVFDIWYIKLDIITQLTQNSIRDCLEHEEMLAVTVVSSIDDGTGISKLSCHRNESLMLLPSLKDSSLVKRVLCLLRQVDGPIECFRSSPGRSTSFSSSKLRKEWEGILERIWSRCAQCQRFSIYAVVESSSVTSMEETDRVPGVIPAVALHALHLQSLEPKNELYRLIGTMRGAEYTGSPREPKSMVHNFGSSRRRGSIPWRTQLSSLDPQPSSETDWTFQAFHLLSLPAAERQNLDATPPGDDFSQQVTALQTHCGSIFVGTTAGRLYKYEVVPEVALSSRHEDSAVVESDHVAAVKSRSGPLYKIELVFETRVVSDSPRALGFAWASTNVGAIKQLCVVCTHQVLLALRDGAIQMYRIVDLGWLGCVQIEENGASVNDICRFVTRSTEQGTVEVFAATKDRIHFTEIRYSKQSTASNSFDEKAPEVDLTSISFPSRAMFIPEEPLELQWFGPHLCVAFEGSITIVMVATGNVHELCDVLAGRPLAAQIDESRILVSDGMMGYLLHLTSQRDDELSLECKRTFLWPGYPPTMFACWNHFFLAAFEDSIQVINWKKELDNGSCASGPYCLDPSSQYRAQSITSVSRVSAVSDCEGCVLIATAGDIFFLQPMLLQLKARDLEWIEKVASFKKVADASVVVSDHLREVLTNPSHPFGNSLLRFSSEVIKLCEEALSPYFEGDELNETLSTLCDDSRTFILNTRLSIVSIWPILGESSLRSTISETVADTMFNHTYECMIELFRARFLKEDANLSQRLQSIRHVSLIDLGSGIRLDACEVSAEEIFAKAASSLQRLMSSTSPQKKYAVLNDFSTSISDAVGKLWTDSNGGSRVKDLNADELIPIVCYLILNANFRHWTSELHFMLEFTTPDDLRGRNGYILTTIEISVMHLRALSEKAVKPTSNCSIFLSYDIPNLNLLTCTVAAALKREKSHQAISALMETHQNANESKWNLNISSPTELTETTDQTLLDYQNLRSPSATALSYVVIHDHPPSMCPYGEYRRATRDHF